MPKVVVKGKVKHFPYTAKGKKEAKEEGFAQVKARANKMAMKK